MAGLMIKKEKKYSRNDNDDGKAVHCSTDAECVWSKSPQTQQAKLYLKAVFLGGLFICSMQLEPGLVHGLH